MAQSLLGTREVSGGKGPKKTFQHRGCMKSVSFFIIHARVSQGAFHGFASNRLAAKTVFLSFL